jgi:hypothetical protein
MLDFLLALKKTTRVFVLDSPQPHRHHPSVSLYGAEKVMLLNNYHKKYTSECLNSIGIPFITLSDSLYDSDGFTRSCYTHENSNDKLHTNAAFGEKLIQEVLHFLASANIQ